MDIITIFTLPPSQSETAAPWEPTECPKHVAPRSRGRGRKARCGRLQSRNQHFLEPGEMAGLRPCCPWLSEPRCRALILIGCQTRNRLEQARRASCQNWSRPELAQVTCLSQAPAVAQARCFNSVGMQLVADAFHLAVGFSLLGSGVCQGWRLICLLRHCAGCAAGPAFPFTPWPVISQSSEPPAV